MDVAEPAFARTAMGKPSERGLGYGASPAVRATPGLAVRPIVAPVRTQAGPVSRPNADPKAEARILVADDEPSIVDLLREALRYAGFEVCSADNGLDALRLARESRPDLLVLDVMMPGHDGFEVVRRLRADGDRIPVLFLTARDTPQDAVAGLTVGGDDYVTKPFSLSELVARIRAVLRRSGRGAAPDPDTLTFADLVLDEEAHEVTKAGELVTLSPTEFKLLRYFLENPGRVLSKAQIIDHVWQYDFIGDANVVESYVSHLRRKVDTTEPRLLHTVRGVGYVLRRPRTPTPAPARPES